MARAATHECKSSAGRPAYDPAMLFKALILQRLNGLSDDLTEYMINDRLSFQAFLGLSSADKSPDAKTLWLLGRNSLNMKLLKNYLICLMKKCLRQELSQKKAHW